MSNEKKCLRWLFTQKETEQAAGDRLRAYRDNIATETALQGAYGRTGAGGTGRALARNQLSAYGRDVNRIREAGTNQAAALNQSSSNVRTSGNMAMTSGYISTAFGALGDYNAYKQTQTPGVKTKSPTETVEVNMVSSIDDEDCESCKI